MSDESSVVISPAVLNISSKYPTPPYTSITAAPWPSPLSISSLSISSSSSIDISKNTMFTFTPAVSGDTTRYLNNILLILFQHHPTGVFESELVSFYCQMFGELISITFDLQYLLQTHPAIRYTSHPIFGVLYTLDPNQITITLQSFDPLIVKPYVAEHVLKLFTHYPNGVACVSFEDTLQKLSQFKLSHVIPLWIPFITSIPFVVCCSINGVLTFMNTCTLLPPVVNAHAFVPFQKNIKCTETTHHVRDDTKCNERSPFFEDHCSVFMGGFKHGTTVQDIHRALSDLGGADVISCTEIKYRKFGFSWVTLSSTKEADYLIGMSPVKMLGANIDIRPFINRERQQKDRPKDEVILKTMIELLLNGSQTSIGLSIRELQPLLYRSLSYRVSGTDLVQIIKQNSHVLCLKTDQNGKEKILFTCQ
eukprot:325964_1